jgi:hypothetical protein
MTWFWGKPRLAGWRTGFAVRCDYPGDGTHDLVGFRRTEESAHRFATADAAFYRRGPLRMRHSVIVISLRDFQLHAKRRGCRSPDCPIATPLPVDDRRDGARTRSSGER